MIIIARTARVDLREIRDYLSARNRSVAAQVIGTYRDLEGLPPGSAPDRTIIRKRLCEARSDSSCDLQIGTEDEVAAPDPGTEVIRWRQSFGAAEAPAAGCAAGHTSAARPWARY